MTSLPSAPGSIVFSWLPLMMLLGCRSAVPDQDDAGARTDAPLLSKKSLQARVHSAGLVKMPSPASGTATGCIRACCTGNDEHLKICKCVTRSEHPEAVFIVESYGKRVSQWPATAFLGDLYDFEVMTGDLDADGDAEIVVANREASGNGMGIHSWKISVIDPHGGFTPSVMFVVEDYGAGSVQFKAPDEPCDILATEWISLDDAERGIGLYLTGKLFRFDQGRLLPAAESLIKKRRYLFSFEKERLETLNSMPEFTHQGTPLAWLSNEKTESTSTDPYLQGCTHADLRGTVRDVAQGSEPGVVRIIVELASGKRAQYTYPVRETEAKKHGITRLGHAATHLVFPEGYLFMELEQDLHGEEVTISQLSCDGSHKRTVLWM